MSASRRSHRQCATRQTANMPGHVKPPGADEPFARFYLKNVAISEGCGCAESVIAGSRMRISRGNSVEAIVAAIRERFFSRK